MSNNTIGSKLSVVWLGQSVAARRNGDSLKMKSQKDGGKDFF